MWGKSMTGDYFCTSFHYWNGAHSITYLEFKCKKMYSKYLRVDTWYMLPQSAVEASKAFTVDSELKINDVPTGDMPRWSQFDKVNWHFAYRFLIAFPAGSLKSLKFLVDTKNEGQLLVGSKHSICCMSTTQKSQRTWLEININLESL